MVLFFAAVLCPVVSAAEKDKAKPEKFPAFPRSGVWLQSDRLKVPAVFEDRLTLVYFWDYSSVNSVRELEKIKKWLAAYHPYGLDILWVHAPEFRFANRRDHVGAAARRLGIAGPVFLDNDFKLWEKLDIRSWPTKLLVSQDGIVVHRQVGEEDYAGFEQKIRGFLKVVQPHAVLPAPVFPEEPKVDEASCGPMSSETYMGYEKAGWWGGKIANRQWVPKDETVSFKDRGDRTERGFFLEGDWANHSAHMEHARKSGPYTDYLGMLYSAYEAYAVSSLAPKTSSARIYLTRDEEPLPLEKRGKDVREDAEGGTYFLVQEPKLYYLVSGEDDGIHELKLWVSDPGVFIHSLSFSNRCLSEFDHR